MSRARLFERLLALFETVAEQRPLVLVIEDAHWADRSTCDLLSFLVRNLRDASALFIVTFRSDDLNGALLRPLLAGLGRMEGVWRVELDRLSRDQVAAQLAGIVGRPPGPALTNVAYRRGGGNPLFTEALVSPDGTVVTELPWSLRDLVLAEVKKLPGETEQVLRIVAVGGDRVGHALLVSATGLDDAALTAALRPAVTGHVRRCLATCFPASARRRIALSPRRSRPSRPLAGTGPPRRHSPCTGAAREKTSVR